MKRIIISALICAIIVFAYQSLSWMSLGIHSNSMKVAPNSTAVMDVLNANLAEEGLYKVPHSITKDKAEKDVFSKEVEGKPWAMISYHKKWSMNDMTVAMPVGFLLNMLAALMIAMIISRGNFATFGARFSIAFMMALYGMFMGTLTQMTWWHTAGHWVIGEVIDTLVIGILSGVWMAWYWGRS
jgi:hypothetical protein